MTEFRPDPSAIFMDTDVHAASSCSARRKCFFPNTLSDRERTISAKSTACIHTSRFSKTNFSILLKVDDEKNRKRLTILQTEHCKEKQLLKIFILTLKLLYTGTLHSLLISPRSSLLALYPSPRASDSLLPDSSLLLRIIISGHPDSGLSDSGLFPIFVPCQLHPKPNCRACRK